MRKWTTAILISSGLGVAGGCIIPKSDCEWDNTCNGAQNDAGGDGSVDVYVPPNCKTPDEPSKDPANCLDPLFAVYLSPQGNDSTGDGSKGAPLASLAAATKRAKEKGFARVVACAGQYDGAPTVIEGRMSLFGGFSCADWTYAAANVTTFTAAADAIPLALKGAQATRLQDVQVKARAATKEGGASIGLLIVDSVDIEARRVSVQSAAGAPAKNGVRADFNYPTTTELKGNNAIGVAGGLAAPFTCPGAKSTTGGKGGKGDGSQGDDGAPAAVGGAKGSGTTDCSAAVNGTGKNGSKPSSPGEASGAKQLGRLSMDGWQGESGAPGNAGEPGGGGGGGFGFTSGGGGGGGAGGCGGAGGAAGGPGGSSFAVVVVDSTQVSILESNLVAGTGQPGGTSTEGQAGQATGGNAGQHDTNGGCDGGKGGAGGDGGIGGAGAGGASIGVLYKGVKPNVDATTEGKIQTATSGGAGGTSPGTAVSAGASGKAAKVAGTDTAGVLQP